MAAVLSPYFNFGEIQDLGVPINVPHNQRKEIIQPLTLEYDPPLSLPSIDLPHAFPADISQCKSKLDIVARCLGGDRAIHFAQHLFITHQYLYAKKYMLEDYKKIPLLLKPLIAMGITDISQAAILDFLAQTFWEFKETFGDKGIDIKEAKDIPSGMGDSTVINDFEGNSVGFWAARELHEGNYTRATFDRVRMRLNKADIKRIYPPKSTKDTEKEPVGVLLNEYQKPAKMAYGQYRLPQYANVFVGRPPVSQLPLAA